MDSTLGESRKKIDQLKHCVDKIIGTTMRLDSPKKNYNVNETCTQGKR